MSTLGEIIKEKRLAKGLKQSELAEGICTQATVSNLENKSRMPTMSILLAIANRLNIEFSELSGYALTSVNSQTSRIFNKVKQLCAAYQHEVAYTLLKNEIDIKKVETAYERKKYYYYLGLTTLAGHHNFIDAHYYFNLVLSDKSDSKLDLIDVLATNGIGIAYELEDELDKALTYYEKSLVQLDELIEDLGEINDSAEITIIYFNSAKFYSHIGNYEKAVNLCTLGITLQQMKHTNYELDRLYYEKAFNLAKLDRIEEATEFYFHAASFAKLTENKIISEAIKKNMREFKLEGYCYWE
ncbi:helix-turn-helix domain-containing protein [Carnobacterium maltaromaticum]|uniref:helix-turn-helix domain-containing protein n=1 Tax=Carnobacterium maltaromaticum TaxID=2751 RepID=UPI00026C8E9A|nr:helix-turn-helix transcriptional regulator [Carnobacterium maltaromaticum]